MSIPLLKDPEKVHDLTDDLESMYWTMVYVALKRFTPPDHKFPQNLFSDEVTDHPDGRRRGGDQKKQLLLTNRLDKWEFSSGVVKGLLQECRDAWRSYHALEDPSQPPADGEVPPEPVSDPRYWIGKCASALDRLDGKPNPQLAGKKRKFCEARAPGDESDTKDLRRSKRLKLLRMRLVKSAG